MAFFKTRVFIATAFFILGMATNWLWMKKEAWHFMWSSGPVVGMPNMSDDPFSPFGRGSAFDEIRRMQEEMMRSFGRMEDGFSSGALSFSAPEITENEKEYRLEIALGGNLQAKNFSVQIERGQLQIQGALEDKTGGASVTSNFSRSFPVPDNVDGDRIQVENRNDRLVIHLPKK
ncbi:MAG TPA: Hsp20/alpha crystallin family protein [Pseudobdellovibrionaceae bacterium]|nr:Hsp20/alpha crystallin family protein [Pseudobdellovibrionaceae bacterium]